MKILIQLVLIGSLAACSHPGRLPADVNLVSGKFEVRVVEDGNTEASPDDLICERRSAIGSRFKRTHCLTRADFEAQKRSSDALLKHARETGAARAMGN